MKVWYLWLFMAVLSGMGCQNSAIISRIEGACPEDKIKIPFHSFEDWDSPRIDSLRTKFQTDTILQNESDEFKRILLLRDWIADKIKISDFEDDYPGDNYPDRILDAALKGQGFHCGHYMIVQNALMNAYGYVTRCLGAGPGVKGGPDGHHGANEIWSNTYKKWFLSDAKYNHHFEKNKVPLSALEVREEYLRDGGKEVQMVKGSDLKVIDSDRVKDKTGNWRQVSKTSFMQTFTWLEWEASNDRFVHWPDNSGALARLIIFDDDYSKSNIWIWDGKPHWAYAAGFFTRISDKNAIEWNPSVIYVDAGIEGNKATIRLKTRMPNVKTFQMKSEKDSIWKNADDSLVWTHSGENERLVFRAINKAGVTGNECAITIW